MSTSASSNKQPRERILTSFQEITRLNIEDCIHFLNEYNWELKTIVEDYYNGKEFQVKITPNSNEEKERHSYHMTFVHDPNLGNNYAKNDRKQESVGNDDHYYALMLHQYGDADESARAQRREGFQRQQFQEQPKGNGKKELIYHEKQQLLRCDIHSLNNLFQIPHLFNHEHLDSIVREFDRRYVNNDYGTLHMGDYDLRILIEAINRCGYQVRQINFYNGEPLQNLPWDSYFGLLMNLNGAHWFTIRNLNGIYYNLDSTFSKPREIGQKTDLVKYLIRLIQKFQNVYIFTVLQQTNSKNHP